MHICLIWECVFGLQQGKENLLHGLVKCVSVGRDTLQVQTQITQGGNGDTWVPWIQRAKWRSELGVSIIMGSRVSEKVSVTRCQDILCWLENTGRRRFRTTDSKFNVQEMNRGKDVEAEWEENGIWVQHGERARTVNHRLCCLSD